MVNIEVESPIRYEKKSNELRIKTDKLTANTCKVVDVGNVFKGKVLVCMGKDSKDITITPIKKEE